jgi:hypothetical protein
VLTFEIHDLEHEVGTNPIEREKTAKKISQLKKW